MADDDPRDDSDEEQSENPAATALSKICKKQLLLTIGFIALNFIVLMAGGVLLSTAFNKVKAIESELPFNRADELLEQIALGHDIVTGQYEDYISKMQDEKIENISKSYKTMYVVAYDGEKEYGEFVRNYRAAAYSIASQVRGSGVWYEFYAGDLINYAKRSDVRVTKLAKYGTFADE